jgi:hypothetical protein
MLACEPANGAAQAFSSEKRIVFCSQGRADAARAFCAAGPTCYEFCANEATVISAARHQNASRSVFKSSHVTICSYFNWSGGSSIAPWLVILGLPQENDRSVTYCSDAGTTFVDLYRASSLSGSQSELFSISPSGEVKSLHRMMPTDFTDISIWDFFAADHTLVTLEAVKRDDPADTSVPRDIRYFLSLSDYDGGFAKLLSFELRFKPLKIAQFGSGDFLVLGWDETNLRPPEFYATYGSMKEAESSEQGRATLALLQRAEFVPTAARCCSLILAQPNPSAYSAH